MCELVSSKPTNLFSVLMCAEFGITCIWKEEKLRKIVFQDRDIQVFFYFEGGKMGGFKDLSGVI